MNMNEARLYMGRALELARLGTGRTLPNPIVGAVIVKDGKIIGEGCHEFFGGLHAERNAFASASEDVRGADMYVTLEPCAHHGKTPPCTEAIIENGIKRVFIGSTDPNPEVSGKGIKMLNDVGIETQTGVLKEECDESNRIFFHYIQNHKPYVLMKYAMSADGKIATYTGDSKWISSEGSRALVQSLRNEYPAIMAGSVTVKKDDPLLTCRIEGGVSPVRIICDSAYDISQESQIVKKAGLVPTFIAGVIGDLENGIVSKARLRKDQGGYINRYPLIINEAGKDGEIRAGVSHLPDNITGLIEKGVGIINACGKDGRVDLRELMRILSDAGIAGVLLEGGSELNFSALSAGIVNEVNVFVGPKLIGGPAKTPVGGEGFEKISEAAGLRLFDFQRIEDDVLLRYMREESPDLST